MWNNAKVYRSFSENNVMSNATVKQPTANARASLGVVVIGRNEGQRLVQCLDSLLNADAHVVYVDSGSTDGSIEMAVARDVIVVELDMSQPFTAARARNAGFQRLLEQHPHLEFTQFVDGDCRVAEDWLTYASEFLAGNTDYAIVCGRRKEMYPEHSLYNRLCDAEWNSPVGDADACGGDFMVRTAAYADVQGFNDRLIAGEEPELCFRLRNAGWKIYRADQLMTHHDAAMTRFGQWWRRMTRSGYAYAARAALHRKAPGGLCRRENLRIVFWAAVLPLGIVISSVLITPWLLALLLIYPLQFLRLRNWVREAHPEAPASSYALFLLLGNWPEFSGQMLFLGRWLSGTEQRLIEYK